MIGFILVVILGFALGWSIGFAVAWAIASIRIREIKEEYEGYLKNAIQIIIEMVSSISVN